MTETFEASDPVVVDLALTIDRAEVLHFLGYPIGHWPSSKLGPLLDQSIEEARDLVVARGGWVRMPSSRSDAIGLEPMDASALVIGLVTVGGGIERRASELLESGETTRALMLDAAGSAAAEEAADRLSAMVVGDDVPRQRAGHVSCRVSPGYGRWAIDSQRQLFEILPHEAVGVELRPSMLMQPRKSISFAMWIGADTRPITGLSGCSRCELERCRYRKEQ